MAYKLDLNGNRFFLAGNSIAYEYDRVANQYTDVVKGTSFDVVDIDNGYDRMRVLVEGAPAPLFKDGEEIPSGTEVVFTNLVARPYVSNKRIAVTATADKCSFANQRGKE